MTRIETLSPEVADRLRRASRAKQRAASIAACEFALSQAQIDDPLVQEILEKVRLAEVLTPEKKTEIELFVARLDDEYFDLQEAADDGRASAYDCLRKFAQARAVAALSFAGNEDSHEASAEAIYEAAAASQDKEEFLAFIGSILG